MELFGVACAVWIASLVAGVVWRKNWRAPKLLALQVQRLRAILDAELTYRELTVADRRLIALAPLLEPIIAELAAIGFQPLAPHVEQPTYTLVRWFVGSDPRVIARASVMLTRKPAAALVMYSATTTSRFITSRLARAAPPPPGPPDIVRRSVEPTASATDALAAHRALIEAAGDLVAFHTLDEILAAQREQRARTIAWRAAQPPDQLLEQDLRMMLGARFDAVGPKLIAKLTAKLPAARIAKR